MDEQKTLLEQIREKESELGRRQEGAIKTAEAIMSAAKREADKILADADARGKAVAGDHRHTAGERISIEVDEIKARSAKEARALQGSGEKNLSGAVDRIVDAVTFK